MIGVLTMPIYTGLYDIEAGSLPPSCPFRVWLKFWSYISSKKIDDSPVIIVFPIAR